MMRPQLIELTAARLRRSRRAGSDEQRLEQRLAVVEGALDREVVDVRGLDRGHLAALDRRRSGRAGGARRAWCGRGSAKAWTAAAPVSPEVAPTIVIGRRPRVEEKLEQTRQQLHGDVLEGERRPVEQLEQPVVRRELAERRDGGVVEGRVGRVDQPGELVRREVALDEGREHAGRDSGRGRPAAPPAHRARAAASSPADTARHRPRGRRTAPPRSHKAARRRGC